MRPAVVIAILAALPLSAALADVYRSVDAQGHVLYSDTPTPGAELVRVSNAQNRYSAPQSTPSTSKPATTPAPKSNGPSADTGERDAASRAVHQDMAQTRAEQCKKAQDYYQQVIQARRIFSDNNGERQYLSDTDADQARVTAKLRMDDACKDQSGS
jgi:hypothetical protein